MLPLRNLLSRVAALAAVMLIAACTSTPEATPERDAQKHLEAVVQADGDGFYGRMAKLGIATIQIDAGTPDPAIATLQTLAQRTDLEIPIDGVLMQLGRAYDKAGKPADAIRAFTRIGDEFPESPYAGDARTELDRLKSAAAGP